jgi:rRNA biogenesis protein RRP5
MLLQCRVTGVDTGTGRVMLASRESIVNPESIKHFGDFEVGTEFRGVIRRGERYGVFVRIDASNVTSLCHVSNIKISGAESLEPEQRVGLLPVGAQVTGKVLAVDKEKERVQIEITGVQADVSALVAAAESEAETKKRSRLELTEHLQKKKQFETKEDPVELPVSAGFEWENPKDHKDEEEDVVAVAAATSSGAPKKKKAKKEPIKEEEEEEEGDENAEPMDVEEEGEKEEPEEERGEVKARKTKKAEKRKREEEIAQQEEELRKHKAPESAAEFERLLRGSPNSSFLWIKYMAHHLSLSDVAKARAIAERAIAKITETASSGSAEGTAADRERLNVWIALLNLENVYGTPDTLGETLERALATNNDKPVLLQMARIYEGTGKISEAASTRRASGAGPSLLCSHSAHRHQVSLTSRSCWSARQSLCPSASTCGWWPSSPRSSSSTAALNAGARCLTAPSGCTRAVWTCGASTSTWSCVSATSTSPGVCLSASPRCPCHSPAKR